MYIVNIVKSVILFEKCVYASKKYNYRFKNVPIARVANVLLHGKSHYYKILYIAFYKGSTYPTHIRKFRGRTENFVIVH